MSSNASFNYSYWNSDWMTSFKMWSIEFSHGTDYPNIVNPIDSPLKIIYERFKGLYVFHRLGKAAIPIFSVLDPFTGKMKNKFHYTSVKFAASRICVQHLDGTFQCLKSRFRRAEDEDAENILDINQSTLKFSIETGLDPVFISDYEEILL